MNCPVNERPQRSTEVRNGWRMASSTGWTLIRNLWYNPSRWWLELNKTTIESKNLIWKEIAEVILTASGSLRHCFLRWVIPLGQHDCPGCQRDCWATKWMNGWRLIDWLRIYDPIHQDDDHDSMKRVLNQGHWSNMQRLMVTVLHSHRNSSLSWWFHFMNTIGLDHMTKGVWGCATPPSIFLCILNQTFRDNHS
jgi:hypothetical protein